MMAKRQAISKKLRFEIFTRDGFACQYCGRKAPSVVLHVDHIDPVSKGGMNIWENLVTACQDCNLGKKDTPLPPKQAIEIHERYSPPWYWDHLTEACDIIVRRLDYFDIKKLFPLMTDAVEFKARPADIIRLASVVQCWGEFETALADFVSDGVPIFDDEEEWGIAA